MPVVGLEAWFTQIPPVTRTWLALSVLTSVAVPWRVFTTFFYFGSISLDFVFHLFFFMRYSRMLEESSFANRKADYFWLLFLSLSCSWYDLPFLTHNILTQTFIYPQGLSPLFNLPFLSSPLAYVPIYFWSRRHPSTPISLFGLLTITAPYLPFALVAFSWVLTGTWRAAASDLVGCAVGHVGWFIRDVWTREMVGGPTIFSEAPEPL
ncbi:Der1-like family-domain-containing protein [Russula vinacea]|nr:Der1-like family-domain-containing protein [Russula vinacea]